MFYSIFYDAQHRDQKPLGFVTFTIKIKNSIFIYSVLHKTRRRMEKILIIFVLIFAKSYAFDIDERIQSKLNINFDELNNKFANLLKFSKNERAKFIEKFLDQLHFDDKFLKILFPPESTVR